MPEPGSRKPASDITSEQNITRLYGEGLGEPKGLRDATKQLREELRLKGLKGFKKGGKVKKTGVYKLHKGEKVVTAKTASKQAQHKPAARKAARRR